MSWLDISILLIVAFSAVFGLARGFVREALALTGWILSVWLALEFAPWLSETMRSAITIDSFRYILAFTIIFVLTLVAAAMLNHLISNTVKKSKLNGTDRALGVLFGVLRGFILVAVIAWTAGFTKLPQQAAWKQSMLVGYFEQLALWMRDTIPPDLAKKLGY